MNDVGYLCRRGLREGRRRVKGKCMSRSGESIYADMSFKEEALGVSVEFHTLSMYSESEIALGFIMKR